MATVKDVLVALEQIAPSRYAYSFDRIGLQVGDANADVSKVVVSLDPSVAAVRFAVENCAQMLISHHPVIWDPLKSFVAGDDHADVVRELIKHDIAFAAAHTNWDCAPGGINDTLAELIGLQDVTPCGSSSDKEQFKIVVFAPRESVQLVIDAMSGVRAGVIGEYERCAWIGTGSGTFRGRKGTNPTVGAAGSIVETGEARVEMVCPTEILSSALVAIRSVHPYEEPAIDVFPLKSGGGYPICRIGSLQHSMSVDVFCAHLDKSLNTKTLLCSPEGKQIRTVVVCGGAAADEWKTAQTHDADAFVTGEVPHHVMVQASEREIAIAAAGHYATENPGAFRLGDRIAALVDVQVQKFEPPLHVSGRPA